MNFYKLDTLLWLFPVIASLCSCNTVPELKIASFQADVTPTPGSPVAFASARSITDSLSARGVVLLPAGQAPVVLCSVDWVLISNESTDQFKKYLAEAAQTTPDRVSVHTLHQHDNPWCDATSEKFLASAGLAEKQFAPAFLDRSMRNTAAALESALQNAQPVTAIGFGEAKVEKVASNRRILGDDGKVKIIRFSSAKDSAAINAPEGTIDPYLKSVSFFGNDDKPLAVLSYYATHPQSYYGKGDVNPEFIGMARNARQKKTGVPHLFFIGAAGNIAAGKYNDGSPEMRPVLAGRIEKAMESAWENTEKSRARGSIVWRSAPLDIPMARYFGNPDSLTAELKDTTRSYNDRFAAARQLAWLERNRSGTPLTATSLQLGDIWLLHLPGEPFIEYQLEAQKHKPDGKVCTAAYGDGGVIYIGTAAAYSQGGYETLEKVNMTDARAEAALMSGIRNVLP